MMTIELPYPPSVNHYWRHVGAKVLISKAGRIYRADVGLMLHLYRTPKFSGPLSIHVDAHPPDARRRDIDNILKALLDALQYGGAYHDDNQIERLSVARQSVTAKGKVCVTIEEVDRSLG